MVSLARARLVDGERGRMEEPAYLTPRALPEVAKRHELLPIGPLAVWASVSPFVQTRAPGSLGAAGCTQVKLEGQVCQVGHPPLKDSKGLLRLASPQLPLPHGPDDGGPPSSFHPIFPRGSQPAKRVPGQQ